MPRIRFRWILQRFVIPLLQRFSFFTQCHNFMCFLLGTKYSICKCMNFLLLLHIFHLIWISSDNIFLIQPRWSSKAWWSVLQPEGGQGKHSPWGETIFKQFIRQVIYRRTVCNRQIETSCLLKIESHLHFWALFLFGQYQWSPDYWIELSFELNQQNFLLIESQYILFKKWRKINENWHI